MIFFGCALFSRLSRFPLCLFSSVSSTHVPFLSDSDSSTIFHPLILLIHSNSSPSHPCTFPLIHPSIHPLIFLEHFITLDIPFSDISSYNTSVALFLPLHFPLFLLSLFLLFSSLPSFSPFCTITDIAPSSILFHFTFTSPFETPRYLTILLAFIFPILPFLSSTSI
jgi:hypothetical protein